MRSARPALLRASIASDVATRPGVQSAEHLAIDRRQTVPPRRVATGMRTDDHRLRQLPAPVLLEVRTFATRKLRTAGVIALAPRLTSARSSLQATWPPRRGLPRTARRRLRAAPRRSRRIAARRIIRGRADARCGRSARMRAPRHPRLRAKLRVARVAARPKYATRRRCSAATRIARVDITRAPMDVRVRGLPDAASSREQRRRRRPCTSRRLHDLVVPAGVHQAGRGPMGTARRPSGERAADARTAWTKRRANSSRRPSRRRRRRESAAAVSFVDRRRAASKPAASSSVVLRPFEGVILRRLRTNASSSATRRPARRHRHSSRPPRRPRLHLRTHLESSSPAPSTIGDPANKCQTCLPPSTVDRSKRVVLAQTDSRDDRRIRTASGSPIRARVAAATYDERHCHGAHSGNLPDGRAHRGTAGRGRRATTYGRSNGVMRRIAKRDLAAPTARRRNARHTHQSRWMPAE